MLDIYTDLSLAGSMYYLRELEWSTSGKLLSHYHWAFIMIIIATFGPYIIQYSSRMSSNFHKGYFQKDKWVEYHFLRKFQFCLSFTFIGLLYMFFIDIILKLEALFLLLTLLLSFLICKTSITKDLR